MRAHYYVLTEDWTKRGSSSSGLRTGGGGAGWHVVRVLTFVGVGAWLLLRSTSNALTNSSRELRNLLFGFGGCRIPSFENDQKQFLIYFDEGQTSVFVGAHQASEGGYVLHFFASYDSLDVQRLEFIELYSITLFEKLSKPAAGSKFKSSWSLWLLYFGGCGGGKRARVYLLFFIVNHEVCRIWLLRILGWLLTQIFIELDSLFFAGVLLVDLGDDLRCPQTTFFDSAFHGLHNSRIVASGDACFDVLDEARAVDFIVPFADFQFDVVGNDLLLGLLGLSKEASNPGRQCTCHSRPSVFKFRHVTIRLLVSGLLLLLLLQLGGLLQ